MVNDLLKQAEPKMDKAVAHLEDELKSLRTGRATTALVDGLTVEVYGQAQPLKALATLASPDAHTIAITPWDPNAMTSIEKAIRDSQSLGLNPSNDGRVIRLNVPPLTEERRREIVKALNDKVESCHVVIRNIRHDVLNEVKRLEKDKQASRDDVRYAEEQLNKKIDHYRQITDQLRQAKEKDIMEV